MLKVKNLTKQYNNCHANILAVSDLDFTIGDSEFVSIVGPSGCGKSTILRMISGLVGKTHGSILIDGKEKIGPSEEKGMVFQSFSLFPWLTIARNILFSLNLKKDFNEEKKKEILKHYLEITGLKEFENAYPKNLSGGMQQRVALARALANTPKILLMDEPFGSLDSQTRSQMQELLTRIWEKEKMTVVFVTHDVAEAAFLSDRIIVLSDRPARIKNIIEVPFPRSRSHSLKKDQSFFEFVSKVEQELENE